MTGNHETNKLYPASQFDDTALKTVPSQPLWQVYLYIWTPMATLDDNNALLLFRVGPVHCCAPSLPVESIITPPQLSQPPGSNVASPGIFRFGKHLVSVTELRYLFGIEKKDWKPGRNIITSLDNRAVAFWVDEILDVIEMPGKGWGKTPSLIPQDIFSQTLLLDKHIFLYTEFKQLAKLRKSGILKKYIEQLAVQQNVKNTIYDNHKNIIPDFDRHWISNDKNNINIEPAIAAEKLQEKPSPTTVADDLPHQVKKATHNPPETVSRTAKYGTSSLKLPSEHANTPSTPTAVTNTQTTSCKKNSKTTLLSRKQTHRSTKHVTASTPVLNKPATMPASATKNIRDKSISNIPSRPASAMHNNPFSLHPRETIKTNRGLTSQHSYTPSTSVVRKQTEAASPSRTTYKDDNPSVWPVVLVFIVLLGGTGYFLHDLYFTEKKQLTNIVLRNQEKHKAKSTEAGGFANVKTMNHSAKESQDLARTGTVEINKPEIRLTNNAVKRNEETTLSVQDNIFKDVQSDVVEPLNTQISQNLEIPLTSVKNNDNSILQQDSPYHAEIAREGNDITIVLYEPNQTPATNNIQTDQMKPRLVPEKDRTPAAPAESNKTENPPAPEKQVSKEEPAKETPKENKSAKTEETVEINISRETDRVKTLDKPVYIKGSNSTKRKKTVIIHVVVRGDTLWAIAKRYVNNPFRYPELARLSKIKNPDLIYPGNRVRIIKYTKN